jgi:hypothetical protein
MPPSTSDEYAQLCFRAADGYVLDAVALFDARRFPGALIACQHALELVGKAALATETGLPAWPPPYGHWAAQHRVIGEIDLRCNGLTISPPARVLMLRLEQWLPPRIADPFPPVNTEYFFYSGGTWYLPEDYFNQYDVEPAIDALRGILVQAQAVYPALAPIVLRCV